LQAILQFFRDGAVTNVLHGTRAGMLAKGVLDSMFLTKLKIIGAAALIVLAGAGVTSRAYFSATESPAGHRTEPNTFRPKAEDLVNIPARHVGILQFLGVAIKPGEKVEKSRQFTVELNGKSFQYRRLRVGDTVERGEIIGKLDDSLVAADVKIAQARVRGAEAELLSSEKTRDESKQRWDTARRLYQNSNRSISLEDIRGAELTFHRYEQETAVKREAIKIAAEELNKAQAQVDSYLITSGVRGIIRKIHKRPGEAVRSLETVVTLQLLEDDSAR
jgi:multidrug efflux pump subunit AcrA (membrane-fusion protein)